MGQRWKRPDLPLEYMSFTKVIFRPIKRLKIKRKLISGEVRKLLFYVVNRE